MIYKNEIDKWVEDGWKIGMYKKGNITINLNGKRKLIREDEFEMYSALGWQRGQGKTKQKSGRPRKNK
jgi:hypothetical protein